jgi:hypothetical protein
MGKTVEIDAKEFKKLEKKAVKQHMIGFTEPPVIFFWDEEGAKNSDLSFGQHAFLMLQPESTGPYPFIWPEKYWKIVTEGEVSENLGSTGRDSEGDE